MIVIMEAVELQVPIVNGISFTLFWLTLKFNLNPSFNIACIYVLVGPIMPRILEVLVSLESH